MIGTITRGYEASAREARIRPVSLLFMPSPYISERRSTWSTLNKRLSPYPEAKAVKHNPPRADESMGKVARVRFLVRRRERGSPPAVR